MNTFHNLSEGKLYMYFKGDLGDAKPDWDAAPEDRQSAADANWMRGDLDKAA